MMKENSMGKNIYLGTRPDVQHISNELLSCLRSQSVKNVIEEGVKSLEKKIHDHESGCYELAADEVGYCKNDLYLLKIFVSA